MKILKNYFWNMSYQIFAIIVPIILFPYVNRHLGPTSVGINSYTYSLAQIFMVIGDLGVANYGTKLIAQHRNDISEKSRIFANIISMRFIIVFLAYCLYELYVVISGKYVLFYSLQGIIILASIFDFSWFFMGIEKFKIITIRNMTVRLGTLILIFAFVKYPKDLWIYILIMSLSNLFGNLLMIKPLTNELHFSKISFKEIIKHLKFSLIYFIPQVSMQVYQTLYKFILGSIVGVEAAGFFDNSDKLVNLILTILSSLSMVILPNITHKVSEKSVDDVKTFFYKYFDYMMFLSFPMMAGLSAISLKFAPWFFGSQFKSVGILLMIESFDIISVGIGLALSSYFISTNQIFKYNFAIISGAVFCLTVGISLILVYGMIGSMWGIVLTEAFISTFEIIMLRKQLSIKKLFSHFHYYAISAFLLFIAVFSLSLLFRFNFYLLVLQVLVGSIIYISCIWLFKLPIVFEVFSVLKRFKKVK